MNILFSLNKIVKHIHSLPFKVLWPKAMAAQFRKNRAEKKEERKKSKATSTYYPENFTSLHWLSWFHRDTAPTTSGAKSSHWENSGFWFCNWCDPLMVILLWLFWNPSPLFLTTIDYHPILLVPPSLHPKHVTLGDLKSLEKLASIGGIVTTSRIERKWCSSCPLKRQTRSVEAGKQRAALAFQV